MTTSPDITYGHTIVRAPHPVRFSKSSTVVCFVPFCGVGNLFYKKNSLNHHGSEPDFFISTIVSEGFIGHQHSGDNLERREILPTTSGSALRQTGISLPHTPFRTSGQTPGNRCGCSRKSSPCRVCCACRNRGLTRTCGLRDKGGSPAVTGRTARLHVGFSP